MSCDFFCFSVFILKRQCSQILGIWEGQWEVHLTFQVSKVNGV